MQAAYLGACVEIAYGLSFCYNITSSGLDVYIAFKGAHLAGCTLTKAHPCCKLGGSKFGVKAQLDVCFAFETRMLDVTGEACLFKKCKGFKWSHHF